MHSTTTERLIELLNDAYTKFEGRIPHGDDLVIDTMTVEEAKQQAVLIPDCEGFTFQGKDMGGPVEIVFKKKWGIKSKKGWTSYKLDRQAIKAIIEPDFID